MAKEHLGFLTFICLVSTLGGTLLGYDIIVVSGTQEQVAQQFHLSSAMQGQFTNMAVVGCLLGVLATICIGDRYSRKTLLIGSSLTILLATIGCGLARTAPELFAARCFGGVGVGVASVLSPLYISEVAPAHLRGRFVTLFQLMINLGILAAAIVNTGLQAHSENDRFDIGWLHMFFVDQVWRGMFLMQALPGAGFFLLCLALPDSPRWLVKEGRDAEAESVIRRIRPSDKAKAEIEEIREAVAHEEGSFHQLFSRKYRRPIGIGLFLTIIGDLSGITAVFFYGPGILERAGFTLDGAMSGFIIISLFIVLGTLLASLIIDRIGRKPLMYASCTGCIGSLLGTGLLLLAGGNQRQLLVLLICAFVFCFGLGLGPIKFVFITEIFPTRLRGRASAVCTLGLWTAVSVVTSLFPILRDSIGMASCFIAFGSVLILTYPVLYFFMPETKGQSLEVLESLWEVRSEKIPEMS